MVSKQVTSNVADSRAALALHVGQEVTVRLRTGFSHDEHVTAALRSVSSRAVTLKGRDPIPFNGSLRTAKGDEHLGIISISLSDGTRVFHDPNLLSMLVEAQRAKKQADAERLRGNMGKDPIVRQRLVRHI